MMVKITFTDEIYLFSIWRYYISQENAVGVQSSYLAANVSCPCAIQSSSQRAD